MLNPFSLPSDAVLFEPLIVQTIRYLKALARIRKVKRYNVMTKQELVFALEYRDLPTAMGLV
jgi:hypothetical protein